jgi:hypothetical protein
MSNPGAEEGGPGNLRLLLARQVVLLCRSFGSEAFGRREGIGQKSRKLQAVG